MNILYSIKVIN